MWCTVNVCEGLSTRRWTGVGMMIALVLPNRVLHVILLDNKVVCSSTTSYPLKCTLTASGGTIIRNLGFSFSSLRSGAYKCAAISTSEYAKANTRLCLVKFGIYTPPLINIPD